MAKKDTGTPPKRRFERIRQIGEAYKLTAQVDKLVGVYTLGAFLAVGAVVVGIGAAIGHLFEGVIVGIPAGVLAAMFVFGRRLEKARYSQVEGQPGAAAAVLDTMRGGWTVTPVVQANKNQDLVHRAVGKPGVVLIGEGNPNRLRALMTAERRFVQRVVADVPVNEILVGDGEGQVALRKLQGTVMKLPRVLKPKQVTEINSRLRALGDAKDRMPVPKGPMPHNARAARAARGRPR